MKRSAKLVLALLSMPALLLAVVVWLAGKSQPNAHGNIIPTSHNEVEGDWVGAATGPAAGTAPPAAMLSGDQAPNQRLPSPLTASRDRESTRGVVSGRVLDVAAGPVADAIVKIFNNMPSDIDEDTQPVQTVTTNPDGIYELTAFDGMATVLAEVPEKVCSTGQYGQLVAGHTYHAADLTVTTGWVVSGRVVEENGSAVDEATLYFQFDLPDVPDDHLSECLLLPSSTSSDELGHFSFSLSPTLRECESLQLIVEHDDFSPWAGRLPTAPECKIVLERGVALTGRVLDTLGSSVDSASIVVHGRTRDLETSSRSDGSYLLKGLPRNSSIDLFVHASGHAIFIDDNVAIGNGGMAHHDISLEPGHVLAGQVIGAEGNPAVAIVTIEGNRLRPVESEGQMSPLPTWERAFSLNSVSTDATGHFRIDDLYAGSFKVSAQAVKDNSATGQTDAEADDVNIMLRLADASSRVHLIGTATDAITGAPIKRMRVTFATRGAGNALSRTVREMDTVDGAYDCLGPAASYMQVQYEAAGYAAFTNEWRQWPAGPTQVAIRLYPTSTLSVQVAQENGSAVPGARVEIQCEDDGTPDSYVGLVGRADVIDGAAHFSGLPARQVVVRARHGTSTAQKSVALKPGDNSESLVLTQGATRKLTITVLKGDVAEADQTDRAKVRALLNSGSLGWCTGEKSLVVKAPDGSIMASAKISHQGGADVEYFSDVTGDGRVSSEGGESVLYVSVPTSALTVELSAPECESWHSSVAEGADAVSLCAILHEMH